MFSSQHEQCVACGNSLEFFGTRTGHTYVRCFNCKTIQLSPFPTNEELIKAYSDEYARSDHYGTNDPDAIFRLSVPFYKAVLHELKQSNLPEGSILDFGCGWGGMCRYLQANNYDYLGIDFSSESLDYCKQLSLNVSTETLDSLLEKETKYSAILLITVFEHLNNHAETLNKLEQLLLPGGVLIILIPTANVYGALGKLWQMVRVTSELPKLNTTFCPPWHTTIFSIHGMNQLFQKHGFVCDRLVPSPSGKGNGLKGIVQETATIVAKVGFRLFGESWFFVLNHIFVYKLQK